MANDLTNFRMRISKRLIVLSWLGSLLTAASCQTAGYLIIAILTFGATRLCDGFNLDTESTVLFEAPVQPSHFGFALGAYKTKQRNWVLIGAPTAPTRDQANTENGGVVYKCPADGQGTCKEFVFDKTGPSRSTKSNTFQDVKSNQWFGATVSCSTTGDTILACAPRYAYIQAQVKDPAENDSLPVGNCFVTNSAGRRITNLSPCRNLIENETMKQRMRLYDKVGACMAGFSSALTETKNSVFLGAPGSWDFEGSVVKQNTRQKESFKFTDAEAIKDIGPYSFMGYAAASGEFTGDNILDVAIGAPRSYDNSGFKGFVYLLTSDLQHLREFEGEQMGSYFGASVTVADVNGDTLPDLVVGAPLYEVQETSQGSVKSTSEVGRVYVFRQDESYRFRNQPKILTGQHEWGRFGQSVTNAGDLNDDGFEDIAVGVPYGGKQGHGCVFIFNGDEDGIHDTPSQIIEATDVKRGLRTFGWSLSGGLDMDGNTYPDLFVGAYASDSVVLLKARPILTLKGKISAPATIDLKTPSCRISTGDESVPCIEIKVCIKESTKESVPQKRTTLAQLTLDFAKDEGSRRAHFLDMPGVSARKVVFRNLAAETQACEIFKIYVLPTVRDKMSSILLHASYNIKTSENGPGLSPVLDAYGTTVSTADVDIAKDCGENQQCIPDLMLSTSVKACRTVGIKDECVDATSFTSNEDEFLTVSVSVTNKGQDSFASNLLARLGPGLEFDEFTASSKLYECSLPKSEKDGWHSISCSIGNPLPANSEAEITFRLSINDPKLQLILANFTAVSVNTEPASSIHDNTAEIRIPVVAKPKMRLLSVSFPPSQTYGKADKRTKSEIKWTFNAGPNVTHIYQLQNDGYVHVEKVRMDIFWPMATTDGKYLLYLSVLPRVVGSGTCSVKGALNPEGLKDPDSPRERRRRSLDRQLKEQTEDGGEKKKSIAALSDLVAKARELGSAASAGTLSEYCKEPSCYRITCDIGPIPAKSYAVVQVSSWLWMSTLVDMSFYDTLITSVGVATVTKLEHTIKERTGLISMTSVSVYPSDPTIIKKKVPWWYYLIAAIVAILILFLLVVCLWKCGFFKRLKTPKEDEMTVEMATLIPEKSQPDQSKETEFSGIKKGPGSPGGKYDWQTSGNTGSLNQKQDKFVFT